MTPKKHYDFAGFMIEDLRFLSETTVKGCFGAENLQKQIIVFNYFIARNRHTYCSK